MDNLVLRRNSVCVFGQGSQPIFFAYGSGCDQNKWCFVTPALEKDYPIILFDYAGNGNSLLDTIEKNYIGWTNFLTLNIMGNKVCSHLGAELTESFCSTNPVIARQFAEATFFSDNRRDLGKPEIPTLIFQCDDDIIAPIAVGNYLATNPFNRTLKNLKTTGHCPHMSAPDETVVAIHDYLSQERLN